MPTRGWISSDVILMQLFIRCPIAPDAVYRKGSEYCSEVKRARQLEEVKSDYKREKVGETYPAQAQWPHPISSK